jgi:hypothetical protein
MDSFNTNQLQALAIAPKITATLSVLSSIWIAIEILTVESKRNNVYNRLLLGMSIMDIAASGCFFASTWPIPRGMSTEMNNILTCSGIWNY